MASVMLFMVFNFLAMLTCSLGLHGEEKNIVFYMHDIFNGPNATAIRVAGVNGTSSNLLGFGTVLVIDDLLTEKPARSSEVVGRAKGFYANSDAKGSSIHMVFSVVFENRLYNGSTLEMQGTDPFTKSFGREVSVVGGTGQFRSARGYGIITLEAAEGLDGNIKFNTTFRVDEHSSIIST